MKKRGLLCLLTAGVLALSACGSTKEEDRTDARATTAMDDKVVMTIDDTDIMKSEYMVYLYTTTMSFLSVGGPEIWTMDFDGQTADELVNERTLDTLQTVVAAGKYAAENEIVLSEEELANAKKAAEDFVTKVAPEDIAKMGVDAEKMVPFMESSYLFSKVYQTLAAEAEVDEAEKAAYYEKNKAALEEDYTTVDVNTVLVKDLETANLVVEKFNNGEKFEDLYKEYEMDEGAREKEDGGKTSMRKGQFKASFGLDTVPAIGEITAPIEEQGAYFIVLIEGETVPTAEEVKTLAEASFTSEMQAAYSDTRMDEMIGAQKVSFVEEVYNNLEKFH